MNKNNHYAIINAISDLQARGFILDFSIIMSKLFCAQEQCYFELDEFDVHEVYCFHPGSRIRDLTHVYAIESLIRPVRGILLISETNAYGRYQWPARTHQRNNIIHENHL